MTLSQINHDGEAPIPDPEREEMHLGPVLTGDLTISTLPAAHARELRERKMRRGDGWIKRQMNPSNHPVKASTEAETWWRKNYRKGKAA